jgi:hypothetical protein
MPYGWFIAPYGWLAGRMRTRQPQRIEPPIPMRYQYSAASTQNTKPSPPTAFGYSRKTMFRCAKMSLNGTPCLSRTRISATRLPSAEYCESGAGNAERGTLDAADPGHSRADGEADQDRRERELVLGPVRDNTPCQCTSDCHHEARKHRHADIALLGRARAAG